MRTTLLLLLALASSALLVACDQTPSSIPGIDAEGTALGVVWLDRNGNGQLDGPDLPVSNVEVELAQRHGGNLQLTRSSGTGGEVVFDAVPVGDYLARVTDSAIPDSLRLLRIDSANVTIAAGDTTGFLVGFTYPSLPIDSVRRQPAETRVFVEGIALNGWSTFADSTIHLRDNTGAIRAVRVPPAGVAIGDSIRLLGRVGTDAGQPVLTEVQTVILRPSVRSPEPVPVTAAEAAVAKAGTLDADLVHIDSAVVRDTILDSFGNITFVVEDGSGQARVLLDRHINFGLFFPSGILGSILKITGILVPQGSGAWVVKPRSASDVVVGPLSYPLLTVNAARARPPGTRLQVKGVALNTWNTFADSTLHIRDATGAIRAFKVPATPIATGDSVGLLGTIDVAYGQPVLRDVYPNLLRAGLQPAQPSQVLTTGAASSAKAGTLDADLIRVAGAVIQDTSRTADMDQVFTVNDGSGPLNVVLDRDVPFYLSWPASGNGQPVIIKTTISVTGLLVPAALPAGTWILKPRGTADVTVH